MAFSWVVSLVSLDVLEMGVVRRPEHRSREFDIGIKLPIAPSVQGHKHLIIIRAIKLYMTRITHRCSNKSNDSRWHLTFLQCILEA